MSKNRTIEGYGIVFYSRSCDLGGFQEVIVPRALDGVLEKSDVFALLDHEKSRGVLARSTNGKGTLELVIDSKGLKYIFDAPDTGLGDEIISGIKRGDIRNSSFAFSVSDGQTWEKQEDGTFLRTITKFDAIYDVSAVYTPAYFRTTVGFRLSPELKQYYADLNSRMVKEYGLRKDPNGLYYDRYGKSYNIEDI